MANKKFTVEDKKDEFKDILTTPKAAEKPNKKPNSDYIRLDLKPFGYDLKDYADKKAAALSIERGKKVSTTAFIQELIIAAMNEDNEKGKKKLSKREAYIEKIVAKLDSLDDDMIHALETIITDL